MLGKQLYGILRIETLGTPLEEDQGWAIILNKSAIRNGAIKDLGDRSVLLLLAISSYMDNDGFCCPTQRQLAEVLGWTQATVTKHMDSLLQAEYNGLKLITRSLEGDKVKHSEYQIVKDDTKVPGKRMSPKDVIVYFLQKYKETYGVDYQVNWKRDIGMAKTKLLSNYSDEQIKKFIEIVFEKYDQEWSSPKYPRPTISALCTWLINHVMTIIQKEQEIEQKITNSEPTDYDQLEADMDDYLNS